MTATDAKESRILKSKFLLAGGLFFLSGFSSLIYQVIWTRLLVFVFGSTTFATSTVLAVFMGGLALGSFFAGKFSDRIKNGFLLYGILEGIIGLWAILAPVLFQEAVPLYRLFFDQLHDRIIVFGLLRFAVVSLILLPPTSCMGATLPLLARFVTEKISNVGNRVGSLYAINTLGAVFGAVSAGFILIPSSGLQLTTFIAASINIFLALLVFSIGRFLKPCTVVSKTDSEEIKEEKVEPQAENKIKSPEEKATIISFFISGSLAMVYEVAWTRSLLMLIGSTTYAFTVMLSTFLTGIFAGSFICSRFADRLQKPMHAFAAVQLCLCLAGFLSLIMFNYLPELNTAVSRQLGSDPILTLMARFAAAAGVMLPITICLGIIFPLAVRICSRDINTLGKSVGNLYASNTLGAIAGAFLAGFLIIPSLGSERALAASSLANMLLGLILLTVFGGLKRTVGLASIAATLCLSLYLMVKGVGIWNISSIVYAQSERRSLLSEAGITGVSPQEEDWLEPAPLITKDDLKSVPELLFYKEGPCANVAVTVSNTAALGKTTTLFTNGHADASDSLDMENQVMLAAFPLLLKPDAERVCVVGWGSGVTSGYALRFPIKELITAEIEPVVLEASKFFSHVNFSPAEDQRSLFEPSDGRNYLLGTGKKFDVIISEPSNPWQAGVCNLFTREYFKTCFESLKPDGVFSMWSQVSELPTKNLVEVYAALRSVFPQVFVLDSGTGDTIAIAFKEKKRISLSELNKSLSHPGLKKLLSKFGISKPEDLVARIRVCPSGMDSAVAGSDMNCDDRNHLEYDLANSYESKIYAVENNNWFAKNAGPVWNYIDWGTEENALLAGKLEDIAESCLLRSPERLLYWSRESMRLHPNPRALALQTSLSIFEGDLKKASEILHKGLELFPQDPGIQGLSGVLSLKKGDYPSARETLEKACSLAPASNSFKYLLALTYSPLDLGEMSLSYKPAPDCNAEKVIELCKDAARSKTFSLAKPGVLLLLAEASRSLGKFQETVDILLPLVKERPRIFLAWKILEQAYEGMHDAPNAALCKKRCLETASIQIPALKVKAWQLMQAGKYNEAIRHWQHVLQMDPGDKSAAELIKAAENKSRAASTARKPS